MEEKKTKNDNQILQSNEKLIWEAPKLYSLDKGKTEGGGLASTWEDGTYYNPNS